MAYTGSEIHSISLNDAAAMTSNFRNTLSSSSDVIAHFFGKDAILSILNQEGCVGIRIYYGLDGEGQKQLILTGVTSNQNDMYNGVLAERSLKCPMSCSSSNPLNS